MTSSGEIPGDFQVGDVVGGTYMIVGYIGRGAMGHLYHAQHTMLGTEYALKILSSEKVTELDWKRFQIEAQATSAMNHPNIVNVYNLGLHERTLPFYVMDLLRGCDLGQKIRADGPLEIREAVTVFLEVCAGIGFAHKKGIIHRDIKPGNIFLLANPGAAGETVKVVDFGIAKLTVTKDQSVQSLTGVGDVVGTPYYMSPEQCMALRVDARSDIYSVGCTLFEALTGSLPFRGRNPTEIMLQHQSVPPPSLEKASGGKEFPNALKYIVATTLAKEPSERYQSMDQLAKDLSSLIAADAPAVVVVPGGITITTMEGTLETPTLSVPGTKKALEREMAVVVSLVVAGLLAVGGWMYWHGIVAADKARQSQIMDQLRKISAASVHEKSIEDSSGAKTEYERQMAALEKAKLTRALDDKKSFSTIKKIKGKSMRSFDFPKDPVIGQLTDWYSENYIKAAGEVNFGENQYLVFSPYEVVGRDPDCLKRFREDEIYSAQFIPEADTPDVFLATVNIKGLKELNFSKSKRLAEPSINTLKQFHQLEQFDGTMIPMDGAALAQAKCWGKMKIMYLPAAKNMLPLLKELQTSAEFQKLGLGPSHLTTQEYREIAKMSHLTYLDVNGNPVTNYDLKILTELKDLDTLNLINSDVDISCLDTLKQFGKLQHLYISSRRLTSNDFKKIKAALPHSGAKQTMK